MPDRADAARGALAAGACYLFWGLVPIYWRELAAIDAVELIAHRHLWSLCVLLLLVAARGGFAAVATVLRRPRAVALHLLSSVLLTTNWIVYVYGVNGGHVTECSLGYFLVPLVNVAAGRFLLHERLRRAQWLAIAAAAVGVGLLLVQLGELPWIALTLAGSWGAYGLMRKQSPVAGLTGLTVETLLLAPLALAFLLWRQRTGEGALGRVDLRLHLLLLSTGVVTALPLVLFAYGAQRLRLATLGLLQYIAPSVQLALAVWLYGEEFSRERATSFALIWAGLVLYSLDNLRAQRRAQPE
jgi:chloramphenicol-sensitive protein RarD